MDEGTGFPGGAVVKNPSASAGDLGSIAGSGKSAEGNGNPLQYSCLGKPMDRRAWQASLWGRKESDTTEQLTLHSLSSSAKKISTLQLGHSVTSTQINDIASFKNGDSY